MRITLVAALALGASLVATRAAHGWQSGLADRITVQVMPPEQGDAQAGLERETKAALLGQNSSLRPLYQLMLAQESGEWSQSSALAKQLKLSDEEVASTWLQALQWAQEATSGV